MHTPIVDPAAQMQRTQRELFAGATNRSADPIRKEIMPKRTLHLNAFATLRILMGALILGVLLAMAGPVQPVQAACGGTTPVSDETELNNAIAAFNAETTTPCVFTIQLSTDIPLTASTTRIDNATSGVSLAIEGGGFAVDGQGTAGVRPFEIGADTAVTMNNLTVTGGNMTGTSVNDPGGGIYSAGTLTLSNSTIFSNSTMASGGGLYVASGSVSLPGTKIISNTTAVRGGGVYLDNSGTLNGGLIQGNSSFGFGGGIYAVQTLTLTGTQILSNTSTSNGGGGLFLNDGGTLNGALIQGNSTTTRFGGGIHFRGTLLTLNDTQVISNTAATNGGGLYTDVDTELIGGLVQGNSATQNGGGIHADGMLTLNGTQVISNTATNGGGLYFNNNATLNGGLVQGNSATQDGGGVESVQQLTLTGTQILSNTATNSGGGLYIINGGTLNGGLVQGNSADKGGGIHFRGTLVALNGTQILTNTAASSGGGLYTSDSAAELIGGLVQGNQTGTRGGGGIFAGNDFSISDTQVIGNSGPYGGGVMSDDGTLRISGGLVQGNSADNGGGLYVWENALITNTQFLSNTATSGDGGGLLFESSGTITGGIVSHNTASRYGGGLARDSFSNSPSNLMLSGTQILNNSAGNAGGGLYLESGTIENSLVQGNQTNQPGGGIYATKGLTLTNSQLLNNPGQQGNGIWVIEQLTVQQTVTTTNDLVVQGNWQQDGVFKQLGGVVKLNGSAAQTIAGTQPIAFTNLEISNASAAGVSLGSDITVTNQLNLVNDLTTTPAYRVNLTSGATTAGAGDVWGNTYRAHNFTDATAYAYGNPNVAITFGAGSVTPSAMLVQLDKGLPAGFPTAVSRAYTVTPTGGGAYLATLRLRYLDTELNGNSEAALDLFRYNGSSWVEHGQSAADTSANWLEQSGLSTFSPWAIGAGVCTTANSWTVSNESELNTAIGCFNGKLVAGSYPITLTQNISLTASTPVINNATSGIDLVINGGGFAVDGQGTSGVRVFDIAASTTVTMNEITVRGGNTSSGQDGGGIENRGNLTLNDSTLVNNKSGRDGSAISNYGILTVTGSTFSGNQAGTAAGVASGGALRNHSTGQLTVSNSTFTGNFGGNHEVDLYNNGTAILDSVTMASFYGFFGHSTTFRNSILLECGLLGINPVDGGHNLVQTPGVCSSFTAPTTLVGVAPLLGPLADNGGETETHALLDGSPAIDTGATTLTTDQRGEARPFGLADDIGAYELRANGTIVITKQTAPANAGDFDFTHNITTTTTFTLTGGQSETFLDVAPGTYTVTEGVEAGWRLVNLRCDDTASAFPSTGDTATRAATINLEPGETVTCTFSNSEDDIIFVQKETVPAGGTGFDFTLGGDASATFTLNDGGIQGISVVSGTYTLTETDPGPDYNLTDIECTVFGPGPTDETDVFGNLATGSVDLTLTSGQAVFCLFTNEKSSGTLTIVKDANPADGTDFDFELGGNATNTFTLDDAVPDDNDGITNTISYTLPVGSYVLTETVPAGWFTGPIISCRGSSSYSVGGNVLFVDVGPGADVVCTFGNRKLATLTVVKQTVGGDGAFDFGFYNVFGTQLDAFTLTTQSGTAQRVLSDLDTLERYEIEETVPAGWTLTNAQCSGVTNDNWVRDGNSLKPLLAPGDNATCTFTNQALACNANAWPVSNEVELNAAISCYNNKTVAGSYTITVTDDIDLTASTTIINNATSGVSLVIEGDGFVVDGQDTVGVRPFEIAADTTVTMNQLAVTGGNIPSDQGGGIYNGGTLTISSSTISDNSALTAGGIENRGTLTVFNSTISGNSTSGSPGGGGIVNGFGGVLTLDSVTISANSDTSATGAGGLWTSNTAATLRNSILAGNSGRDCGSTSGTPVTDGGHNLVGTQSNCGLTNGANGNIVGSDPLLGPLADNGGETETHALLGGSPAIDAGSTSLTTDQRGVTRPQFGVADIGAYESVCGTATGWTAATELELDTAIGCFNKQTVAGSYTITVTGNISLTSSIAAIDNPTSGPSLVIVGGNHTIDGGDAPGNPGAGGFIINSPTAVSITDLTVTRSRQLLTGGAIRNPNGGALTLNNVSLTHNQAGFGGGALSSTGPVTITNSVISHNYNPAGKGGGGILIESPGSLTLIDSEVSDNTTAVFGGGISAESGANLTITRSVIDGNRADVEGGGIFNDGSLTIDQSTVSGNTTAGTGGGVANGGGSTVFIRNSTISGNSAPNGSGGGWIVGGNNTLDGVTIANNTSKSFGAGVFPKGGGVITMTNSILADNTSTDYSAGSGVADCGSIGGGHTWVENHNLVEDGDNCGFANGVNNTITGVDPVLGPLADNGGDTDTHALLPGSPAIDTGATSLTTDQRGVTRPQFGVADIGAYESLCGTATSWTAATELELDTAIGCFNKQTVAQSYTITVTGNFSVTDSIAQINNPTSGPSLVIEGDNHTIDGKGRQGFGIQSATAVTMNNLTLTGWRNLLGGGAIRHDNVDSHLTLNNMNLTHNTSGFGAGALFSRGVVTITNSTFYSNTNNSVGGGGAIEINGPGKLTLIDSELTDNASAGNGGAILAESNPTIIIEGSEIEGNMAADSGGGIYQLDGTTTISDSSISNNTAVVNGGGILNSGGNLTLNNATVAENTADTGGGGIYNGATLTINQSTVANNITTFSKASGGGIANVGTLTMQNSTVSGNTAVNGGGISNVDGTVSLDSVTIAANTASSSGAGLFTVLQPVGLKNSILAANTGASDCETGALGSITDNGNNLVGTQSGCGFTNGVNGNIVGSDPLLGPLADNGGETETHALLGGSPAIDTGATSLTTDQRGVTRPQFGVADIGAYESLCGTATSWTAATEFELDTAIGCFNKQTVAGSYTITVTGNISLTSSIAAIDNPTSGPSLVIVGGNHTIDGGDAPGNPGAGGFVINSPTAVSITDLTVTRSRQLLTGGAIRNPNGGALTLNNVSLTHNQAGFGGGALSSTGPVTITNSLISHNYNPAGKGGGGILIESLGSLTLIDSEVSDNTTAVIGGGIYAESGANLTITRSTISGNSAARGGGGLANFGSLSVGASTLSDNSATGELGGGIYNADTGSLILTNSTLSGNNADLGGGIYNDGALDLDSVTIANNTVTIAGSINGGGALYAGGDVTMNNSILAGSTGSEDCYFTGLGSFVSGENNLIETQTTGDCGVGADIVNTDPKLGPLADNGGETDTHALLGGSPAINAGDTALTTDQRGVTRPQGAADDMGALEAEIGTITIIKDADPADDTPFDFTITGGISDTFTLRDPSAISTTFSALVGGKYEVTELLPAGWELAYIDCQHGPNSFVGINYGENRAYITLAPGDDVTCTFNNKLRLGSLTVVKNAVGGDGAFPFTSPSLGTFTVTTASGAGRQVFPNLLPGAYSFSESVPAGWRLDSAVCTDGSPVNAVQVDPGEDVTCTFTNTRLDTIVVVKRAVGGDGSFAFTSPQLGAFNLKTLKGEQQISFANLAPGSYSIAETAQPGWTPTVADPVCSNGDNASNITLAAGETVVCVFVNLKQDTLVVEKRTVGGDGSFNFASPQLGAFALNTTGGAASQSFTGLSNGVYNISETVSAGWVQSGASCSDGSSPASISLAPGASVSCVFTNTKLSSITVVKNATGGDGSFDFSSPQLGSFNLATTAGTAQQTFSGLAAGSYAISETVPAGWDLTGATCSDGSPVSAIDLAAGEDVTCRFANVNRGGLIVVKNTVGGDGQFAFTSQALGGFTVNTSGGSGQQAFPNLVPGTYDLAETIPAGWRLESATCSDGSSPASVTVDPGENVTCTFTNTKLDTIVIVKRAVGGDGVFTYTSQALGGFALTTANGEAQRSFDNLAPGVYDVSENATAGWTATVADPVCSNGDNASNITLAAGQTVVCVFVNLKQDTITVEKRTVGGDGSFVFASPQLGSFSLNTTGGAASQSFTGLSSGSYSISETLPAGWVQSGASCTGGVNPASISLAPGANVSCVFTNTKLSSITVVKNAAGGDGTFAFSSPQLGSFNLATAAGAAQQSFSGLAAGSYAISETVPGGWDLTSATCSDGSNPAAINLAAGENVTCTFANTRRGGLTVVKKTIGGDGSFAFTSAALGDFTLATSNGTAQRSFANLIPGSYDLLETAATGWDLTSATCSDGSNPASVDIGPGENVTCTFANTKRGSVTIVKNSVGGDGQFGFTSQRLGGFSLATANGTAAQSFANLVPGVYAVSETTQAGWDLTGATCSDGSSPASINLGAGENVTCTFVNQKRGSLTVVKNAVGGDGVFPFTSGSLGSFVLTTTNGAAQTSFSNILSGTYSISESVPAGWAQSAATCSDGSNPANIAIGSGEDVTCTFTNTKLDTIVVVKRAVGGDGSFAFNSPQLGAFNLKTVKGEQTANFSGLGAGSYSISETVPTGWTASVADPVCSNGDNASNITLAAGQTVVCVFVNLKQDTITVEKRTVGGDGSFVFASPQLGSFSLNTTGGSASRTFSGLSGGSYSISETLPAGWVQSGATCSDGSDLASISLVPGANVSCIFTNTQLSSITVVKNATGGDGSFDFSSPQLGSVVLTTTAGTAQQSFGGLAAGSYAISETVPAGWDLSGATCSDGSPIDAIALTPGENVTCTFANTKQGSLTVVKQTVGSDGAFNFTSTALGNFALTTANGAEQQSFANLRPGRYDVAEAIPAGWRLSGATCSDGSAPGSVDIGPGEAVTCTFANEKLDSITVIKRTVGGDGSFDFGATGSGLSNFSLNTAQGVASISFDNLVSGSYSISESVPAGWTADVADPVCSNGDNASAISLAAGESVVCEFVNRKKDSITIIKRSVGGDGSFNFTSSLGSFALTTSGGVTSTIFSNVVSGTYSISESVPAGWVLTSASCDNGDSPASISLGSGENVSCTFVNTKLGNITILKETAGGNGRFTFDGDLGSFSLKTADGLAKQSFGDLAAGRYRVSENSLTGWTQSSATCSDGSDPAAIDLAPGENVTCRFVNTKNGSLRVIKQTVGGDGSFAFASQTLGSFGLTSVGGTGQQSFANLLPGSYDLAETVPAGWDLTSAVCSDGSSPARIDIAPGEDVSCTFVNTKRGSISIVKQSVGGDGSFAFTSPALGNFSLSSVGGTAQQRFTNLLPGVYPIRETAQNGWDLRSAVCSDGSDPASINLGAGEDVTCTFVNTKRGSLTVVKEATGGDDSFAFVSPALGSFVITTTGGAGQASFANLQPGSYAISETVAGDWRLTSAQCDNGSPVDAIAIGAGEDVTCTFANLKDDTIVVIKRAVGGDGSFAFTGSQGLGSFSLSTVQGVAQQSFGGLAPGSYAISETVPAGWTAQDADPVCSNGQRASSLNLAAGESIVCEFVNLKQNSIVIQKRSLGGDGTFNFVSPQLGAFGLSTQSGVGSRAFTGLTPGQSYAISESVPAGWVQSGASCDNGSSPDNITLAAGATATCTFTNTRLSSVTILKQAIGGDARFAFSGGLGDFSVKTAGGLGKQTLRDLAAGSYTISETVASGWVQSSASCSDGSDPASLPLGVGENVTCTFVNTKLGSLSVVKQATGGDGSFAFVSQALGDFAIATTGGTGQQSFANLQPGSYDLAETIPAGWRLESAVCSDGSDPASIDIGPGENVTCTFANTKLDSITVVKRTVGGDASFDFTATGSGLSNFSLSTANGVAQQLFSGLGAGSYSIGETAAPGWHAQDVDPLCSNGDRASAITLAAGESVVCEFVNHKDDTITIVKRTVGGDASFDFTATGSGLSNFSLSTANGVAQQSFSGLAAGVYSISEQTPSGWDLTSAVCNNGDSPTNIVLGDGENVVCTFVNTKRGSITLVKNSTGGDGSFDFSVAGSGLSDFRLTTVGGTAQQRFDDLLAGTYAISETAQAGWELTSATCSDGSSLGAIHLEAGEDLTCTVENSALGSITVVKQATGGDGSFGFASQALGSFVISTTGGTGQVSFANLQPGSYDIRESGAPGWNLVSGNCDNGDSPATLILTVGEDVTCTFVNELPTATPVGPIYLPIIRNEPAPQPTILYLPLVMNLPGQIVPQVIYSSNFMQGIGPGWSAGAVTTTSPSGTTFLGGFGAGGAQLHLPGLSAHGKVRVELDLYIIRSWDGNQVDVPAAGRLHDLLEPTAIDGGIGPDRWMLKADGQTILDASFTNFPEFTQSYPAAFGSADNPAHTGSFAVNSLGYTFFGTPMDASYRISRTFDHTADTLNLNFEALGLQPSADESWGINNLSVVIE